MKRGGAISGRFDDRQLSDAIVSLVSRAAAAILAMSDAGRRPAFKADKSPVTAADAAAEELALDGLAKLVPGVPVISEEAAARGHAPQAGSEFFLVDPLDGTREFIAGRSEYTVNVALVSAGSPVLGVIAAPALGLIWRTLGAQAERLALPPGAGVAQARAHHMLRTRRCPEAGLTALVSRSHFDAASGAVLDRLPVAERLACGSSLKFCRLAEGAADIYPRLAPTSAWDIAAGQAILQAAGGTVLAPGGEMIRFGDGKNLRVAGFIAWGDVEAARRLKA